jgi:predicted dehydrogenase
VVLRVGVVGVNGIGLAHLWALKSAKTSELAAVCDIDAERAAKAAADFEVPAFTDPHELYGLGALDAVVIATPPGTHGELVRDALAAQLHVYCEKPITPTADEGYALADAARERGRVLQIGFQNRLHAGYTALRETFAELGALRRAHVTATNWFRTQRYFDASPWRATWRMAGGGVLMAQAVHQIDALIATVGMPTRVRATARTAAHRAEVEDVARAELEWENGASGTVVASLNEPAGYERFELIGSRGAVMLENGYDLQLARYEDVQTQIDQSSEEYPSEPAAWAALEVKRDKSEFHLFVAAHREFAAAIEAGRPPAVDGTSGTRAVEFANAVYLSAVLHDEIALPLSPGAYSSVFEELASGRRVLPL